MSLQTLHYYLDPWVEQKFRDLPARMSSTKYYLTSSTSKKQKVPTEEKYLLQLKEKKLFFTVHTFPALSANEGRLSLLIFATRFWSIKISVIFRLFEYTPGTIPVCKNWMPFAVPIAADMRCAHVSDRFACPSANQNVKDITNHPNYK